MKDSNDTKSEDLVMNLRGIKTSTDVTEQYIENLFECLLQNEAEFLDSLATPLAQNPINDLAAIKRKNSQALHQISSGTKPTEVCDELQVHQQPVLSVEIYLDIERRKEYVLLADSVPDINESGTSGKELVEQ